MRRHIYGVLMGAATILFVNACLLAIPAILELLLSVRTGKAPTLYVGVVAFLLTHLLFRLTANLVRLCTPNNPPLVKDIARATAPICLASLIALAVSTLTRLIPISLAILYALSSVTTMLLIYRAKEWAQEEALRKRARTHVPRSASEAGRILNMQRQLNGRKR